MSAHHALARALGYPKFRGTGPFRLLVPVTGYHLQTECARALRQLGHTVLELALPENCAQSVKALLHALVAFKPDALLVVNHLGFDDGHQLGEVLDACAMPVACWYCDSPFFVLKSSGLPAPAMTSLFVWEKTLLPTLGAMGAQDVHHLPLGCDTGQFSPVAGAAQEPRFGMSFVGHSMRDASRRWQQTLGAQEQPFCDRWTHALAGPTRAQLAPEVAEAQQAHPKLQLWDALGAATFVATQHYRDSLLSAVAGHGLHIFGDKEWASASQVPATLHPPVPYGPPLAQIYRQSAININATSLQMPTAVNQRVFDAPSAGGFVLSDRLQDIEALFDVGEEAVVYRDNEQLKELAVYYQTRHDERNNIIKHAQRRIEACHTYKHRMQTIVRHLQARHG